MVGFDEIILIAIVALFLFGPNKLPEYIREFGRLYAEFKKAQRGLESEFNGAILASTLETKQPSQGVLEIAKKMNIHAEGKTEEQLLKEIDVAISSKEGNA